MLRDKLSFLEINPEAFDRQKSTLVLTTVVSVVGLGALAALEALGVVNEAEVSENPSDS
jgi:hypothetical protein